MSDVTPGGAGFDRDRVYPVLPLRDIVVFPGMIVPLFVGRDKSVVALEKAMAANKEIFLVAQLDPAEDDPGREPGAVMPGDRRVAGYTVIVQPLGNSGAPYRNGPLQHR